MKTRKSPLRFAKLAVALCLVLPFLAFGLWDALLAATAPFAPATGEALPAAGRQNATACLLYGCAHSLNQSLQGSTDGWTLDTATDPAQQQADFLGRVDALAAGGVLDDFQYAAVLGTVFLFTALCLSLRAQPGRRWLLALLVLLGAAVAPAKAIYLPVVLLCLAIPPEHLDPRRAPAQASVSLHGVSVRPGRLVQAAVLALAAGLWVVSNASALGYAARDMSTPMLAAAALAALAALAVLCALYLRVRADAARRRRFWRGVAVAAVLAAAGGLFAFSRMGGGLTPDQLLEVQPNGDSVWTFSFGYICRNLPATLKLLLRTLPEQGALWLQGLLGTTLGEPIVYRIDVSWLLGVGLVLALLAAALPTAESAPLGRRMAWGTAGILACVALAVLAAALNWTPINYQTLFGMQGRYLLPVLPLALLLLRAQRLVALRRSAAHGAALAVALLTLLTQLQGFALYAAWQPVS